MSMQNIMDNQILGGWTVGWGYGGKRDGGREKKGGGRLKWGRDTEERGRGGRGKRGAGGNINYLVMNITENQVCHFLCEIEGYCLPLM